MFRTVLRRTVQRQVRQYSAAVATSTASSSSSSQIMRHPAGKSLLTLISAKTPVVMGWTVFIVVSMGWPLGAEWLIEALGGIDNVYSPSY